MDSKIKKEEKILVAVLNTGWIHKQVSFTLLNLIKDRRVTIIQPSHRPIENNRNLIVKDFLVQGFDWLLMMDSDNPPVKNPLDLINDDKDVIIFPTPVWHLSNEEADRGQFPIYVNCLDWDKNKDAWRMHPEMNGWQEIDAGGTGCILIARRVLEGMTKPFERTWDDEGVVIKGSDYYFCEKVKKRGCKIWTHYDYPCLHLTELELGEVMRIMAKRDIKWANAPNINTKEYWNSEWNRRPRRIYSYYHKIADLTQGKKVLDYGCGRGDLMAMLDNPYGLDISEKAIEIVKERGMKGEVGTEIRGNWEVIVATEVLEHLDNDRETLQEFFNHTDEVIYAVPYNSLPPSVEPEHRRVYTREYIQQITPYLREIMIFDEYLLVLAKR